MEPEGPERQEPPAFAGKASLNGSSHRNCPDEWAYTFCFVQKVFAVTKPHSLMCHMIAVKVSFDASEA